MGGAGSASRKPLFLADRSCFSVDTGGRQGERPACDRVSRLDSASAGDTRARGCPARVAAVAVRTALAGTCLHPGNRAPWATCSPRQGTWQNTLRAFSILLGRSPPQWGNWRRLSRSYRSFGVGETEAQREKVFLPPRASAVLLDAVFATSGHWFPIIKVVSGKGSKSPQASLSRR